MKNPTALNSVLEMDFKFTDSAAWRKTDVVGGSVGVNLFTPQSLCHPIEGTV